MKTRVTELLGIEAPIIQGAMARIANASLAGAVSEAGGLGIIACGGAPLDWVEDQVRQAREITSKPIGANVMLMDPNAAELAKLLCELKVDVVTTGAGSPANYMEMWKEAGIKVIPVVASTALAVRMERYCRNAEAVADFLAASDKVEFVNYPTVKGNPYAALREKYLPKGASGVISFSVKGGRDDAVRFMDSLSLANNVVHVADICTCVLHPASSTHRQLTDEQLVAAGITPGLIRLSVGLEHIDDILADIQKGLDAI